MSRFSRLSELELVYGFGRVKMWFSGACSSRRMAESKFPIFIDENVMSQKAHGTCPNPTIEHLRWNVDWKTADRICCFNRHYAEHSGYFVNTNFISESKNEQLPIKFYDSVTGKVHKLYNIIHSTVFIG